MKIKELLEEIIEKADKPLNKPMQSDRPGKKKKVYVKDPSTGNVKTVHYGDTNYKHNYSEGAKKNFRARHNCSEKTDKTKPGYWACRDLWPTNKPAKKSEANMKKDQLSSLGFTVGDAPSLVKSEQSTIDTEKVSNHLPTRQGMEKSSRDRLDDQINKGSVELSTPTMMVILRTPKQEKRKQPRIEELDKQHGEEFHGKEMPLADVDHQVEEVERSLSKEELLLKALDEISKAEVKMPKEKFVAEHKKLVGVLESPSKKDDKKEAKEQKKELKEVDKGEKEGRCWEGYKPTPGKKPYSEGSCTKKAEDEKFDFDGNKKLDAHEKQHKKIAEKLEKKKVDKSLDSLIEMISDQTDVRKLKRVHENTVQRPQVPYQFVRSMGKGGIVFNFGTKTGNIFADKATELLTQNADPIQQATVQNQDQAYQKALDSYVQTGQATVEMQTTTGKTLEKGFDEQVKEAYENGTLYDDPSKPAVKNEYNKSQLKMNGEVIKATSETDAALIEMMQSQADAENDGSVVIDATQGVTVEC